MRREGSVTAVSWIPSESVTGAVFRVPFEVGFSHYDEPPPEVLTDVDALLQADRARFVWGSRAVAGLGAFQSGSGQEAHREQRMS